MKKKKKEGFFLTVAFTSQKINWKPETNELQNEIPFKNMDLSLQGKINKIQLNKNNHIKISFQNYMLF